MQKEGFGLEDDGKRITIILGYRNYDDFEQCQKFHSQWERLAASLSQKLLDIGVTKSGVI